MPRNLIAALGLVLWVTASLASPPCKTGEAPLVACTTGSKEVLVCVSEGSGGKPKRVRYQFGSANRPDIEIVAVGGESGPQFRYSTQPYSRGSGFEARFTSGSYLYVVYDYEIGGNWPRLDTSTYMGVLVFRDSRSLEAAQLPAAKLLSVVQCIKQVPFEDALNGNLLDNLPYVEAASLPDEVWPRLVPLR